MRTIMFKKYIIKMHQILGSLLSLIFFVWFASGIVMIFAGFPHAPKEKLFKSSQILSLRDSIKDFPTDKWPDAKDIELSEIVDIVCYSFTDNSKHIILNAKSLKEIELFSEHLVDSHIVEMNSLCKYTSKIIKDYDQWIPWSHFNKYFPIKKYYFQDSSNTVVYVSLRTGQIVQQTTRLSRNLARIGAIPHWFYFKYLRLNISAWTTTILWFSGLGSIMCLAGLIAGIYRYRKRNKAKKKGLLSFSPYKKRWYKWHHILGFIFGLTCFTFVFSGMMSLTGVPRWIVPIDNNADYRAEWTTPEFAAREYKLSISEVIAKSSDSLRKIKYDECYSKPSYSLYYNNYYNPEHVNASVNNKASIIKPDLIQIKEKLRENFKGQVKTIDYLEASDDYYGRRKGSQLPVLRVKFNDSDKTYMYISLATGKVVRTNNKSTRLRRWLYKGLHSLNFKCLDNHDTLRKILLVILCLGGLFVSYSGIILSFKFIRRLL